MAKKRKTPSSPRSPHAEDSGVVRLSATAETLVRDTDERDLGDLHPDFVDDGHHAATQTDLPALAATVDGAGMDEITAESPTLLSAAAAEERVEERRLTATLLKIFARRREQIGLSLEQLSRLSGIAPNLLQRFENPKAGQTITYDQTVVLARVLGFKAEDLPGLRRRESRPHLGLVVAELERTLLGAPLLRFEGQHGERYGGDVERAAASKAFTVRIEDSSMEPVMRRGALLGFMSGSMPRAGGVLLLRHRRSSLLAMRRYEPPSYAGLVEWQPAYVVGGEWHVVGTLEVVLPSR